MSGDILVLVLSVATVLATLAAGAVYVRRRGRDLESFLTARGSLSPAMSLATVVASIMGGWILFSPAETATFAGLIAVIGYGVAQALPLFGYAFLGPKIRQLAPQGRSLTDFVWFRYGKVMYVVTAGFILFYMVVFAGAEMGAIARVLDLTTDLPLLPTIIGIAIATLAYTAYGGLRASIFTDRLQFLVILPLIAAVLGASIASLGGWSAAFQPVSENFPELLDLSYRPGIELSVTFFIGILAANLFHQGFWQRVYAAENDTAVRRGFLAGGVIVIVLVVAGGLFGLWAVGQDVLSRNSPAAIALFALALEILPFWAIVLLVLLALILVMSSIDTLLNGMASLIAADTARLRPRTSPKNLLLSARVVTALLTVPAILIGYFFESVLYPFFLADLVCAAGAIPVFLGMYSRRFGAKAAIVSLVAGLICGAVFFPTPSLAGWWEWAPLTGVWDVLASGRLLASFLAAVVVSSLVAGLFLLVARIRSEEGYDLEEIALKVSSITVTDRAATYKEGQRTVPAGRELSGLVSARRRARAKRNLGGHRFGSLLKEVARRLSLRKNNRA